jgi:nitroimidazol reductase NimA-like FMN-containing flavoprotein (pyridoxamine 5'-phosphate oxidase superfamily)
MNEVHEMAEAEIQKTLGKIFYGHLGCSVDDRPYVVPIHFAYKAPHFFIYTNEGKKTEMIAANPNVCLQVEDVVDGGEWRSVVISGTAERITDPVEREAALHLIMEINPTLTPAMGLTWVNNWIREKHEVVYRIVPEKMTGRSSEKVMIHATYAQPGARQVV